MTVPAGPNPATLVETLRQTLNAADTTVLQQFPIEDYVAELDAMAPYGGYRQLPSRITKRCVEIERKAGQETLETYHRLLLASLIIRFDDRLAALAVPPSMVKLTRNFIERLWREIEHPRPGYFDHGNDRFAKDLAVCRLKMLLCGPEVVDLYSGLPRRSLFASPYREIGGRMKFVLQEVGGFRPFYETHMDRRLIGEFSPEGYDRCYGRLAQLLQLNPGVKGVIFGATWFVDPALEAISPELSYLRKVPVGNGAKLFPAPTTEYAIRDATRMSLLRKRLFEEGRYQPQSYLIVWPRRHLIEWAEDQAAALR